MKVLLATDFYADFELYETDNPTGLKNYATLMVNGYDVDLDPKQYKLLGSNDNLTVDEVRAMADETIFISDLYTFEEGENA